MTKRGPEKTEAKWKWRYQVERARNAGLTRQARHLEKSLYAIQRAHAKATDARYLAEKRLEERK